MVFHLKRMLPATVGFVALAISVTTAASQTLEVTLDWLPSPEYYGFYYAQKAGLYQREGLQVTFQNASGAPVVAAQLGAGSIKIGTTTSDNILRQAARGVRFSQLIPLMLFNPVTIVSLPQKPVNKVENLKTLTLGTNPQTSTYAQYEYLLRASRLPFGLIKEYPIGYGGAAQLLNGEVDAFLAYTTNQAVDVELERPDVVELFFGASGLHTYGLVLAVTTADNNPPADIVEKFIRVTIEGYKTGGINSDDAVEALVQAEPTLKRPKVKKAIEKIVAQNAQASKTVPLDLDSWVSLPTATAPVRSTLADLYQQGLSRWSTP